MRRDDLERLQQPYPVQGAASPSFAAAIGAATPNVTALAEEIANDLDPVRHGVGWWAPHPGTSRRILISDQLYVCATTIETNIVEAKLHLFEALHANDQEEARLRDAVTLSPAGVRFTLPESTRPADDLPDRLRSLHIVGMARALASTLDCIGAVMIGVLALPTPILKSDLARATKALEKLGAGAAPAQANARTRIAEAFAAAGPQGWETWVDQYRNMLVHRGRRLHTATLITKQVFIHTPRGDIVAPQNIVPLLPNAPGKSEVQAFRDGGTERFLLTESGWATLEGALGSTLFVSERVAAVLREVWTERRNNPQLLTQPAAQWPDVAGEPASFDGYEPGTIPVEPTQMTVNPMFAKRLLAASLDNASRPAWGTFD